MTPTTTRIYSPTPGCLSMVIKGAATTTIDVREIIGDPLPLGNGVIIYHATGGVLINEIALGEVVAFVNKMRARVARHEAAPDHVRGATEMIAVPDHIADVGKMVEPSADARSRGNSSMESNSSPGASVVPFEDLPQRSERPVPQFRPITHLPGLGQVVSDEMAREIAANFSETVGAARRAMEPARFLEDDGND